MIAEQFYYFMLYYYVLAFNEQNSLYYDSINWLINRIIIVSITWKMCIERLII